MGFWITYTYIWYGILTKFRQLNRDFRNKGK